MVGVFSNKISRDELKPGDHIYSWRRAYLFAHHGIYVGDGKVIHFTRAAGQEMGTEMVLDRYIFSLCPSHPSDTLLAWARKRAGIYVGDGKVINYTRVAGQEMGTQTVLTHYISSSCPSHPSDTPCPQCGDQSSLDGVLSSCIECFLSGGDLYIFRYAVSPALFLAQARGGTCTLAASDPPEDVLHRADFLLQNGFGVYHISKNNCEDFAIYCKTGLLVIPSVLRVRVDRQRLFELLLVLSFLHRSASLLASVVLPLWVVECIVLVA
ncbi:protein LEAD-SENSITIVE 1-like [Actinidia eriantha]|uniref:protein LEAD-SENSITIVE 1-like n=1 Tax=Actinidia eriantha TaxID=165200 RepID=UPI0025830629|nr:protein LEAD-SENSITIVE 1-like [Actinidia eriantha]